MTSIGGSPTFHLATPVTNRLMKSEQIEGGGAISFPDLMASGVQQVNNAQLNANAQVHDMLTGGDVSQVEVMTAVQKADMAFRLLVQVRNKLMSAYEEINNIRI